jgi:hypothetical protein
MFQVSEALLKHTEGVTWGEIRNVTVQPGDVFIVGTHKYAGIRHCFVVGHIYENAGRVRYLTAVCVESSGGLPKIQKVRYRENAAGGDLPRVTVEELFGDDGESMGDRTRFALVRGTNLVTVPSKPHWFTSGMSVVGLVESETKTEAVTFQLFAPNRIFRPDTNEWYTLGDKYAAVDFTEMDSIDDVDDIVDMYSDRLSGTTFYLRPEPKGAK